MKFTVNRKELCSALESIKSGVKPAVGAAYSQMTMFTVSTPQKADLTGYNLETGVSVQIEIDSDKCGEFLVNTDKLCAITARLTEDRLECEVNESNWIMTISCGHSKAKIFAACADNYPSIPSISDSEGFEIDGKILADMIRQTVFAVSRSDCKPILRGELFEIDNKRFTLVAIDGYRLAVRTADIESENKYSFVVDGNTLNSIAKMIKDKRVTVTPSKKYISFDFSGIRVFSRLLEGEFHNYKASIPPNDTSEAVVSVNPFLNIMERFMLLIDGKNKAPVVCNFSDEGLDLSIKTSQGEMNDHIDIDFVGTPVKIGFNASYLVQALRAVDDDKMKMCLNTPVQPMKIIPLESEAYTYLVLPVRLKAE